MNGRQDDKVKPGKNNIQLVPLNSMQGLEIHAPEATPTQLA